MTRHMAEADGAMLFVPGYMRTEETIGPYGDMMRAYGESVGLDVIPITWHTPVVGAVAEQVVRAYVDLVAKDPFLPVTLAGFSMGSVAVVQAASFLEKAGLDQNIASISLESLSPAFGDHFRQMNDGTADTGSAPDDWGYLHVAERSGLRGEPLPDLHKPIRLYVGEEECGVMQEVAHFADTQWGQFSQLHVISKADHNASDPRYVATAKRCAPSVTNDGVPLFGRDIDFDSLTWHEMENPEANTAFAFTRLGGMALRHGGVNLVVTLHSWYCFVKNVQAGIGLEGPTTTPLLARELEAVRRI